MLEQGPAARKRAAGYVNLRRSARTTGSTEIAGAHRGHQREISCKALGTAEISAAGQTERRVRCAMPGPPQHRTRPTDRLSLTYL